MKYFVLKNSNWVHKFNLTLLLSLLCLSVSYAQSNSVKGVVTADGEGLPGASVVIKGTQTGTLTDENGKYQIPAGKNDVLVVSFIGYLNQEVKVNGQSTIDIDLKEGDAMLDEVVVVGYGTMKREDLTGSVASIKGEELDKVKPVSFEGGIAAKAAGVQVISTEGGPGAGFKVRVRGGSSINASNDPLYVIDGFAIEGSPQGTGLGLGNSSTSPLANIDPSNIESIEVLKDASATAIYGSRGANGVILITTKKGKRGRANLNFESNVSLSTISKKIDLLSAQEFVDWRNEFTPWDPNNPGDQLVGAYRDQFGNNINLNDERVVLTDWQDEILRTAVSQNYKLSATGGSENSTYAASFSYLDQEGIIKTSNFERFSGSLRLDQNIGNKIKAGANLNAGYNSTGGVVSAASENANGRSGIVTNAVLFGPVQGLTRYNDAEYDEDGRLISLRGGDISNPTLILNNDINTGTAYNIFGNVYAQYDILDNLTFKSSIRLSSFGGKNKRYFSEKFGWGQTTNGRAYIGNFQGNGLTTEQNLNYRKRFGKHGINLTAVYEQQKTSFENITATSTGFDLPNVNLDNLGTATVSLPTFSTYSDNSLRSYLGRAQYDYGDKFVVNVSARYDGSSRFAEGNKWGFFPSAGFAWKAINEPMFQSLGWLSDLKFKLSYGETGNTAIGSYRSLASASLASTIFNGNNLATGVAIERLANNELTWETTAQADFGIVIGLLNNRVNLEADYYNKKTTDLLLEVPLPATSGYQTAFKNLGAISNKGFEFVLNTVNVEKGDLNWTTNFNISFNKNRVLDLGGAKQFFVRAIGDNQIDDDYIVRVGSSLGSIFGLEVAGVYNYDDFDAFNGLTAAEAAEKIFADAAAQGIPYFDVVYTLRDGIAISSGQPNRNNYRPGMPKFVDQLTVDTDGDGIPDAADGIINANDRTIIGRTVPDFFGGITNNFTYKNFDFSILAQYSVGNDVYNKNIKQATAQAIPYFNKYGIVRDRWTPTNPNGIEPGVLGDTDGGISGNAYSTYVEDGSFLRLANITLGYSLNKDVARKLGIKNARFYGSIDNLYNFTTYSGYDPDVSVGNNQLTPGLDVDSYPRARFFRVGLSVGF